MITDEVLGRFDQGTRANIKAALVTLHLTEVLKMQILANFENLCVGNMDESPEILATKILEHRAKVSQLAELDSIGETYSREMNHNA